MTKEELEEYKRFMSNTDNIMNCSACPENIGASSEIEKKLPCGQQHCWVRCHTWKDGE